MHDLNEMELWRQRREELIREAENRRLVRQLKMARPKKSRHFGAGGSREFAPVCCGERE